VDANLGLPRFGSAADGLSGLTLRRARRYRAAENLGIIAVMPEDQNLLPVGDRGVTGLLDG
jgi:hypothetical protein